MNRDKEKNFKTIKKQIHQEDITIPNMYTPKNRSPKYTK